MNAPVVQNAQRLAKHYVTFLLDEQYTIREGYKYWPTSTGGGGCDIIFNCIQ